MATTQTPAINVRTRTGMVHKGIRVGSWTHPACMGTRSHNRLLADTDAPVTCTRCLNSAAPAQAPQAPRTAAPAKTAPRVADRVVATQGDRSVVRRATPDGIAWVCLVAGEVMNVHLTRKAAMAWL